MTAFDLEAYDPAYIEELKQEIAQCERRLTCLLLSAHDRDVEEQYLRDLRRHLAREQAKRPSHVIAA